MSQHGTAGKSSPTPALSVTGTHGVELTAAFDGAIHNRFAADGVRFTPCIPSGCTFVTLNNLPYREMVLSISITGTGTRVASFSIDGRTVKEPFLSASGFGGKKIEMVLN
ncbi:MAG: hypothetical protein KAR36_08060 [Candidatus Latescibacteria bacterium]|nr:hypothetical protein [Candidatus Latescibacterota bacterium]